MQTSQEIRNRYLLVERFVNGLRSERQDIIDEIKALAEHDAELKRIIVSILSTSEEPTKRIHKNRE